LASLLALILNAQAGGGGAGNSGRPAGPGGGMPSPGGGPSGPGGGPSSMGGSSSAPGAATTGAQQVRLWPDKTANRLVVSAPKSKLPDVEKLIGILDVEKPEDVGVRVIPLKNVSAEDLVKEISPLYQKLGGKSLKDMIEVTASSRANSLIV